MAKKLIVTERQLQVITQHINENNKALDELLSEGVIEEGFKEIALSLLMLAGVGLSGQNKAIAQDALTNDQIVQQIDATLADTTELNKVISRIDKRMPGAGEKIMQNADQVKATINYIDDKNKGGKKNKVVQNTQTYSTTSPSMLRSKLKQGYALSDIKITNDTILAPKSIVTIQDTIDYKWSSDNFFQTGTFQLNQNAADSISTVIADINAAGGKVIGVYVESSTDTEPIRMGNDKLAQLRANSVEQYIRTLSVGDAEFKTTTKPNSGPNLYKSGMSKEDRVNARIETAQYRYVNVRLVVVFEEESEPNETAPQVIERHRYELVKVNTLSTKTVKIKYHRPVKTKSHCKKVKTKNKKGKTIKMDCELFGGSGLGWAQ